MEDSNSPFNGSPSNNVRQFLAKKSAEFNDLRTIVWGQDSSLTVVFRPNMTQPIEGQKNWHRGWIPSGIQLGSMILHVLSMIRICNPPLFLWTFWVKGFQMNLRSKVQKTKSWRTPINIINLVSTPFSNTSDYATALRQTVEGPKLILKLQQEKNYATATLR